ncbi:MAG TPA: RsmD family RNA methyltransferase [Spirochaetota bacterium]|nr:RsmD family RNA methyltransferase [Spirochaetota bacterium]HPS85649.1 RsmD family RNA methyltransferase [Spirochaetota bacterium]
MKGTIRIISGLMKGRVIPFNVSKFNDAEITPQKVKGALFSIIGENLNGKTFIDLYSGSGQIGFEALSRKCSLVVMNEKDRSRVEFIRNFITQSGNGDRSLVLNLNAKSALKKLSERGVKADIVFLDPPYDKEKGATGFYDPILRDISESGILHESSELIIQHYSANLLPESCGKLNKAGSRKYGSTSLSIYHYTD